MGERGPARTPTKIRQLHGENRPSQINRNEPQPAGVPRMPTHMAVESRVVWRRIIRDFGPTGVLTAADSDVLRLYCDAVARYNKAARLLDESSPLLRGRHGDLVKNPMYQVVRDNATLVRALAREIGLTPAARAGLTGNDQPTADPLERFLEVPS